MDIYHQLSRGLRSLAGSKGGYYSVCQSKQIVKSVYSNQTNALVFIKNSPTCYQKKEERYKMQAVYASS